MGGNSCELEQSLNNWNTLVKDSMAYDTLLE